ncbi:WD40-repeat-containing domain protein [Lipomyces tetrasporus]|uniref:WD40-repeat-containing domain protein n=1 Tax=Lipomyces tetrasporus TaxID=54092 RepID=A0AAD7VQ12_9ASCO|nr:WD40-repeat-containing domain protein [Lipomyces tetrasporus]KAJ8097406.1 WD40-repeat-containing domain protein [Lipomyces tetrasporus]
MAPVLSLQPADDILGYQQQAQLERHNAVRRRDGDYKLTKKLPKINRKGEAWIRELVKPPSLENLKPQLATDQWQVPDPSRHLTCISSHQSLPTIAVGSGGREKNLFIYEMALSRGESQLYHRQTVSLPHIYSLSWAPLGRFNSNTVIASGHRNGVVHLLSLPDSTNPFPARILRKFSHADPVRSNVAAISRISHLEFTSAVWTCVPDSSLITLYGESLYLWDLTRSDRPMMSQGVATINGFHASPFRDGILALNGAFGIALLDVRTKGRGLLRPKTANHWESTAVKWSPYNSNWVASAHEDSKVRVWDIRAAQPFAELYGHSDIINALEWSATNPNELISGSYDQNINIWNVTNESFAYDAHKSKEKYFSTLEKRDDATIIAPDAIKSTRRRRALFTILEDPDDSVVGESTEGVKSYRQRSSVLNLASVDVTRHGKEFCSINTDGTIALHQMKRTIASDGDKVAKRRIRRDKVGKIEPPVLESMRERY